jgi:NtrC-family two-component system response regulator AlgB
MNHSRPEPRPLRILVVDDEENIRLMMRMCLEIEGHRLFGAATIDEALDLTSREAFDLIFLDVRLGNVNGLDYIKMLLEENPWARIIVITAFASIQSAVEAMKRGASDYLPKPFEPTQLRLLTQKVAERRVLERKVEALQKALGSQEPEADLSTSSPVWRESIEFARRIATANSPVLIRGESGTGKGWLARAIHEWSPRCDGPFTSISFDGKSVDAIETELFGSGSEAGAIALCHGGTLLIKEISNLPMRLQPRILSVIRDKEFEKQDHFVRRPADVRIVSSTGADLAAAVGIGRFREDLLMALGVSQVSTPSLRERKEDILPLAERYLGSYSREHHKPIAGFTRDAAYVLKSHAWPGNCRELRNVVERAVIACDSDFIGLEHLPVDLKNTVSPEKDSTFGGYRVGDLVPLEVIEEAHIQKVLASAKTIRRAAAILGLNASALCRRLKRNSREESEKQNIAG